MARRDFVDKPMWGERVICDLSSGMQACGSTHRKMSSAGKSSVCGIASAGNWRKTPFAVREWQRCTHRAAYEVWRTLALYVIAHMKAGYFDGLKSINKHPPLA
ncbi:hypothetical protein ANCCEY_08080 [Ancylostoma ceylanicum]|uniref:Uncharacterized protein n=1 Tax=Ancylostoma ceylanicum TaxID=53326 RepID=A0A0D6LLQ9_9BILA|nr:hypothetical protein ANCCEY_08080 [Ancylostoma ceylanicum]